MASCKHAASGCNYPEGQCLGLCVYRQQPQRTRIIEFEAASRELIQRMRLAAKKPRPEKVE